MIELYRKYLKKYKKEVILGPLFKLIEAIFELIVPLVVAYIIDHGIKNKDFETIYKMGGVLIALAVVGLCSTLVCQFFASKVSQKVGTQMRKDLYVHINSLSNREIDKLTVSSLQTRLINDTIQVQNSIAMLIRLAIRAPFIVIGATIMSFIISPTLAIIFVLAALAIGLIIFLVSKFSLPHNKKMQQQLDDLTVITKENLTGARVVRAFSKQQYEQKRFYDKTDNLEKTSLKIAKISSCLNPLTSVVVNMAIVLIIYFGMFQVESASLTQGQIISLVNYMTQISIAIVVVANLVVLFSKAGASSKRINEVFNTSSSIKNGTKKFEDSKISIEFKKVDMRYSAFAMNALTDINFKVESGRTLGIIGGTGAGKSTLINLLMRFYDVNNGEILINGQNIKNYDIKSLRENIAIVHQKPTLFSGTIKANLKYGKEDATEEEMYGALKMANAYDFVCEKEGLETMVLQGGKNFSGGQKQRLAIARALIRNPKLLILDDATSALDYKTEAEVKKAIFKNFKGTMIVISQRVATIKNLDQIIVLEDGLIVSSGNHCDLYETCEVYREICDSQLSKDEVNRDE